MGRTYKYTLVNGKRTVYINRKHPDRYYRMDYFGNGNGEIKQYVGTSFWAARQMQKMIADETHEQFQIYKDGRSE